MKRVLLIVLVVLVTGLGIVLAAAAFLLGTERGAGWALRFAPEELSVERIEGRLVGPLVARGVDYESDSLRVAIDSARIEWRPTALLTRRLRITAVEAHGVDVWRPAASEGAPTDVEREPMELPELELPMPVEIEELRVTDLRLHEAGAAPVAADAPVGEDAPAAPGEPPGETLVLEEIAARGSARDGRLRIASLRVRGMEMRASVHGELTLAGDYPHDLRFAWDAALPDGRTASGSGRITGDRAETRLRHGLANPVEAELSARLTQWSRDLRWRADLRLPRAPLSSVRPDLPPHRVGLEMAASGSLDSVDVRALTLLLPRGAGRVAGRGGVGLAGERPSFDLTVSWEDLSWPPGSEPVATSPAGELHVSGTPQRYEATLQARAAGAGSPPGQWRLRGRGTETGFRVTRFGGEMLEGRIAGGGALSWDPHPAWDVTLSVEGLNPAAIAPEWPGRLDLRLLSRGGFPAGGPRVDLELADLHGDLRGREVDGGAALSLREKRLEVDSLRLRSGAARIAASGRAGEVLDLSWRLVAEELGDLAPGLRGSLSAEGTLSGPAETPLIVTRISGSRVRLLAGEVAPDEVPEADDGAGGTIQAGAREVEGRFRVDLSGERDSDLDLRMLDVVAGGARAAEARLEGRGRPADHRLELTVADASDSLRLALAGSLVDPASAERAPGRIATATGTGGTAAGRGAPGPGEAWRGRLDELVLTSEPTGGWRLRERAPLVVSSGFASLEALCLSGPGDRGGEVCVRGAWRAESGAEGWLRAEGLPLGLLDPFLPASTDLEGSVEAEIRATRETGGEPEIEARVRAGPGVLSYVADSDRRVAREYDSIGIHARIDGSRLIAGLSLEMPGTDGLRGDLRVERRGPPRERALEGALTGRLEDRGLLGTHADALAGTSGTLRVDLGVAGTAAEPRVTGVLRLEDAAADLLPAGVRVEDLSFDAMNAVESGDPALWRLTGGARSGEGSVTLDGTLRLSGLQTTVSAAPTGDRPAVADGVSAREAADGVEPESGTTEWELDMTIDGERFRALAMPLARVVASPHLRVRANPEGVDVGGEIRIPRADITPEHASPAVPRSEDVILLQRDTASARDEPPVEVRTEVRVVLGDSVFLDGFGLSGRLEGSLVVVQSPGRPLLGRGEVQILEGEYTAYRQRLTIDRGRLIFADSPIRNPGLDLRVVRRTGEVLAGLDIGGTARAPEADLFSEPPMADADALAYLLLGRPTSGASREEGELLQNAATSAGLAGGQLLAARLGQVFGLEEARIERGEDADEASLVLGTYISPRLYLGYGIGLFEAVSVLTIRYELGRGWILQTESGLETGTDILYRFEP